MASVARRAGSAAGRLAALAAALLLALALPGSAGADDTEAEMMKLDFKDAELTDVINAIAEKTGTNFIYDDRVRGRVTIISPSEMTIDQAYAVFESVLQVKGFTTVRTPGGALKVIPLREAKETSVDTSFSTRRPANRDTFITRLIPLRYIDAASIVNTLKPLVSKDAAIAAYEPTNTVILTESASNIRRLIAILESVDVETYREELAVIRVEFADAATMAQQISEIFGAAVSNTGTTSRRTRSSSSRRSGAQAQPAAANRPASEVGKVRIITDARTNALIVLAPRTQLEEVRRLVRKLDVPVTGGGRIHVYYLQHADAEELAQTLTSMITGRSAGPSGGQAAAGQAGGAQALRSTVAGLAGGISVTADPATNSLVIQASQEGYSTLQQVIAKLDVARPQVLVEALIMEVDVASGEELGFNGLLRKVSSNYDVTVLQGTDSRSNSLLGVPGLGQTIQELDASDAAAAAATGGTSLAAPLVVNAIRNTLEVDDDGNVTNDGSFIQGVIRASASDAGTNILSAPHILTSDNEEAEIRVGDNIPIVTSRVDAATGGVTGLSTSVNVERQDIGVTLRVTPQITEGDTLRLDIFQEISTVNTALTITTSLAAPDSGVALSKRTVENTVVVSDGETVVIGGLIGDDYEDTVVKIPWLGDIPFFGWLFKTTSRTLQKQNLLVFLTPHIVRTKEDLEFQTIRKRQELVENADEALRLSDREQAWERERMEEAEEAGEPYEPGRGLNPIRHALLDHESRYPVERMREIERLDAEAAAAREVEAGTAGPTYFLQAGLYTDEGKAVETLTDLVDLGFDGALVTGERGGRLLYEVRVGPYDDVESARTASRVLERSQGLSPSILIEAPATPDPPDAPEQP